MADRSAYNISYRSRPKDSWRLRLALSTMIVLIAIGLLGPVLWSLMGMPGVGELDLAHVLQPPLTSSSLHDITHWLGTDAVGRDVLAITVYGTRTALVLALSTVGLACIVGLITGVVVGYYGDERLQIRWSDACYVFVWVVGMWCIGYARAQWQMVQPEVSSASLGWGMQAVWTSIMLVVGYAIRWGRLMKFPFDAVSMRLLDFWKGLPALLVLLVVFMALRPSYPWGMMALLVILLLPNFIRHARAETLRHRSKPSVHRAVQEGRGDLWIMRHAILPYVQRPLLVLAAFYAGSVVVLEATLSFLGLGLPVGHVSWGGLIHGAREAPEAWWLIVFPGVLLIGLVWSIQEIGRWYDRRTQRQEQMVSASVVR